MGWRIWKPWIARIKYLDHTMVSTPNGSEDIRDLDKKTRTDWNWIKKILDKVNNTSSKKDKDVYLYLDSMWPSETMNIYTNIDDAYEHIINFIKWYNDNK